MRPQQNYVPPTSINPRNPGPQALAALQDQSFQEAFIGLVSKAFSVINAVTEAARSVREVAERFDAWPIDSWPDRS